MDGRELGPYDLVRGFEFSPDTSRYAFAMRRDGKTFLVVDGERGPAYDPLDDDDFGCAARTLAFSPDGRDVAYWARLHGSWRVFLDRKSGPRFHWFRGGRVFSPDSQRLACAGKLGERWQAVVDHQPGATYLDIREIEFTCDSRHCVYTAQKQNGKWVVVRDGQEGAEYDGVGRLYMAPSGSGFAYIATCGDQQAVVTDGQVGPWYEYVHCGIIEFSPDGRHVAYVAQRDDKWEAVVDGQPGKSYDRFLWGRMVIFSSDSQHFAYAVQDAPQPDEARSADRAVMDRQEGPAYDVICGGPPEFNADGSLEYLAVRQNVLYRVKHVPIEGG